MHSRKKDREQDSSQNPASRGWLWRAGLLILLALGVALLSRLFSPAEIVAMVEGQLEALGVWGPVLFVLGYVVATVALFPASAITLAAGALFGLVRGVVVVSLGSTAGAALAFLVARYLLRKQVESFLASRPRLGAVDKAVGRGGWRVVALLRLSPAIPFNLQNYLYGVTSIPFGTAVLTSWIAMLPGTFLYVYLGVLLGEGVRAASGSAEVASAGKWTLLVLGLLATVAVTVYVTRLARQALAGELGEEPRERESI